MSVRLIILSLIAACAISGCTTEKPAVQVTAISEDLFLNPPPEARPGALWPWLNGYVDQKQLGYELEQMKAKGMRGAIIWDIGTLADRLKMIPVENWLKQNPETVSANSSNTRNLRWHFLLNPGKSPFLMEEVRLRN